MQTLPCSAFMLCCTMTNLIGGSLLPLMALPSPALRHQLLPHFAASSSSNIAGGYLATRYTAKLVLGLGVLVWSAFTIATPLAAANGDIYTLLACRMLMGAGEGVTFPAIQHLTSSWVPRRQRSRANSLVYSGDAGAVR